MQKNKLCEKFCSNEPDLRSHKAHHLKEDCQYLCSSCEFKAATKLEIYRHSQSHIVDTIYQCSYCYKKFKRNSNLKEHIKAVHAKGEGYECQLCNFSTQRRSSLYSHMKGHDESFIECICPICGSKFKSKAAFKYHLLSHADAKSFSCKVCGKMFTMASRLRRHEIQIHGPKNFECSTCHKTFPTVHHLNRHKLIHTGDKPFSCQFCSHSTNTQGNIVKHIKLIHGKIEDSNKYFIKKSEDNVSKAEKKMDEEELKYLKAKGKDIAVAFLKVLNVKGLANTTFDQLKEKKKIKEQQKMSELNKKLKKLANARKTNCKKNCNVIKKEVGDKKINLELSDSNILEDEYSIQHVEEVVENDCAVTSPASHTIQMTLIKLEIPSQLKSEAISTRSVEHIKNMKQFKQFIVDENDHLSHTSIDIQGKGSRLHIQNAFHSNDTFEDYGNIDYSNIVLISQEDFEKKGKYNKLCQENEHPLCKDPIQKTHQKLLELKEKVYIVAKDKTVTSEILGSSKERKANSANGKRKKRNSSKQKNSMKHPTTKTEISIKYKNLGVDNHSHILSPLLISNNGLRISSDASDNEEYNKPNFNDQNSILDSRLDHMYYNFKIIPSDDENGSITQCHDVDLTDNQVNLNTNQTCVVLDAGKSRYFNYKDIVSLYISDSSNIVSEDYIFHHEKDFTVPRVNIPYVPQGNESTAFLPEKSYEETELCYHLLNLGSDSALKLFQERTPSKLQININAEENISAPYVNLDYVDTGKDFEKIIINDAFNQTECSNEDVNLESIAEIEETSNSEVTLHIVNDY